MDLDPLDRIAPQILALILLHTQPDRADEAWGLLSCAAERTYELSELETLYELALQLRIREHMLKEYPEHADEFKPTQRLVARY